MRKILFCLLTLSLISIFNVALNKNHFATATALMEEKEETQEQAEQASGKLTIEKGRDGVTTIHQHPAEQKKPADEIQPEVTTP